MPTLRPRVSVTLSDDMAAALDTIAEGTGMSRSSLISEFLESALPVLNQTAIALNTVRAMKPRVRERIKARLPHFERTMEGLAASAHGTLDLLTDEVMQGMPKGRGTPEPPSVNKGVRQPGTAPSSSSTTVVPFGRRRQKFNDPGQKGSE